MTPSKYAMQQKKELVVKATEFSLILVHLYKTGPDEMLHTFVP